jgi:hypothetical protein
VKKSELIYRYYTEMSALGLNMHEADVLRRAERTLQRWGELECGNSNDHASWSIERDEHTGVPYMVTHSHWEGVKPSRRRIPDREAGALRRVQKLLASHADLWFYHQGDPRGCCLYVGRKSELPPGAVLDQLYTRGTGCCY